MGSDRAMPAADRRDSRTTVALLIAAAVAVVAAFSPARPVGVRPADALWAAAFAGLVALAGSRARPGALLWLAALTALVSVRGDTTAVVVGVGSLILAFALVVSGRRSEVAGSVVAGLAVLALLWGPSYGFTGLPSLVAAAAVAPVLVEGWLSLGPRGRRRALVPALVVGALVVVAAVVSGLAVLSVRQNLSDAAEQARAGLALVRDGNVDDATTILDTSAAGFGDSADVLGGVLGLPGRLVPVLGHQVEALRQVSGAGEELTATAAEATRTANYRTLRAEGGRIDLAQMEAMRGPVQGSLAAARHAQEVVRDVRSPWLLEPLDTKLDELDAELVDTVPSAELANRALEIAPTLLGAEGPQHYLLQFATPGESRAAGGYVGTYGLMVTENGELDLAFTGSTEDINVPRGEEPRDFDPPPGWDERYSTFHVDRFPGNVTADPDWPTDAGVARQLYAQIPPVGEVQGALYADPSALAALLELTGPISVAGLDTPIDASNVERYLLVEQYVINNSDDLETNLARREVLGNVTEAVFDALTTRELPSLRAMLDVLGPAVAGGHLKLSVVDERAESLLDEVGLSGAWAPTQGADYLSVRTTDLFANKIDSFVNRSISVRAVPDEDTGAVSSTVSVTLTNTAPASGLPWYVIGNSADFPAGTARDAVALYSPLEFEAATLDGTPVGLQRQVYGTGYVYTFPVVLLSGQTRELIVTLRGELRANIPYQLDLLPQPRATPDHATVTIDGPAGPTTAFDGPLLAPQLVGAAVVG